MNALAACSAALAAVLAAAGPAGALELAAVPGTARYDATEKAQGGFVLNRDRGRLHGATLRLSGRGELAGTGIDIALEGTRLEGGPGYTGLTQIGLPLSTGTRQRWQQWTLRAGPVLPVDGAAWQLQPALTIGGVRSERAILASPISSPTTETLTQRRAGAALALEHRRGDLAWRLQVDAAWTWRSRLDVDTFGLLDRYALHPDGGRSRAGTLAARQALGAGWWLGFEWRRSVHVAGPAPSVLVTRGGQPAAVSTYPGSRTWLGEAGVVLARAWP